MRGWLIRHPDIEMDACHVLGLLLLSQLTIPRLLMSLLMSLHLYKHFCLSAWLVLLSMQTFIAPQKLAEQLKHVCR